MIRSILHYCNWQKPVFIMLWATVSAAMLSCTSKKEQILAKVYDDYLYLSDVNGIFQKNMTLEDSTKLLDLYVDDWVRNKLFENEALKRISNHDQIEKQVKEYRSSLINFAYQNLIVKERLDTILDEESLSKFYEDNKEGFRLDNDVMRCFFVKIPKAKVNKVTFEKIWDKAKPGATEELLQICSKEATLYMLEDTVWNNADEIFLQIPKQSLKGKEYSDITKFKTEDDEYFYYLQIFKYLQKGETAPYSYARKRITDIFLLQRKKEIVEQAKDKILEKESRKHNFSIYTDRLKIKSENK